MSSSSGDMAKGDAQLCGVGVGSVTPQAYGVERGEDQHAFDVSRYAAQPSDMDRTAYQPFEMGKDATHQACEVARNPAHQFEVTRNAAPLFDMSLGQSFEAPRGIQPQFEMARGGGVQDHYDVTRGVTHHPFEAHRGGSEQPYDMGRVPPGYEMGRGGHQYEMPRTQPYEMRPAHLQEVPQLYNYDKGFQECPEPQDTGPGKGHLPQSLPDFQQSMEMPLEMPKTAPQPTVRTKPGQKTSGHPFDFAKGYAQQLEMAKKAAQNAIQAKIKAQEEERAREATKLAERTKQEEEETQKFKANANAQPSAILKLYAQQLQMMRKSPKSSETARVSARQQEGARVGGSKGDKRPKKQCLNHRLGRGNPLTPTCGDVSGEEKHGGGNGSVTSEDDHMDEEKGDPPPFEMAKYMAQLSKTKSVRTDCQEGQDSSEVEGAMDALGREKEILLSPTEATKSSGIQFPAELMENFSLALGTGAKGAGVLRAKRDRQELTIANKAKLIEQVESRGAKKKADIAREWGLRPSTLSTIMKNKEKILTQFRSQRYAIGRRRMRTAAYPDVEEALLTWFRYARAASIPITGPVLQGMGVTLAQELGHPEFSCSVGWLDRFKARHGLSFNPKNSQDSGTSGTFNESQDRVPSPAAPAPHETAVDTDAASPAVVPPAMPAVAPDVTPAENSSSWLSNAMSGLGSAIGEADEQLDRWFPENMTMDYDHPDTAEDLTSTWLSDTVPGLLKDRRPRDIFSAGEAALFYSLLPDKSLAAKGEDGHKWTWVKERVTLLVAVNMDGSEKLPLLVIGQKPAGQATDSAVALPLPYETNDSAMMTSALFESWLRQLDQQYQASNRTISIILESCPAHLGPKDLSNVELVFLPADTTSRLQPVEQGVIHALKSLYRRAVLEKTVDALEANRNYEVTLREAMELLQQSWEQVKTELIVESFKQAGLEAAQSPVDSAWPGGEDAPALLERARRSGLDIPREITFESFLKIDNEVQTTVEQEGEAELRAGGEGAEDPTPPGEALHALATLRKFMVEQGGPACLLDTLADVETWVTQHIVKTEVCLPE